MTINYQGPLVGEVVGTDDPEGLGRLQVRFPQVSDAAVWCGPALSPGSGASAVPGLGAFVLVIWENNDFDGKAFWIGVLPPERSTSDEDRALVRTRNGVEVRVLVQGETVTIASSAGPAVVLDGGAVRVSNGSGAHVALEGPTVDINHGALVVT